MAQSLGTVTKRENGGYEGTLAMMTLNTKITIVPNEAKETERQPNQHECLECMPAAGIAASARCDHRSRQRRDLKVVHRSLTFCRRTMKMKKGAPIRAVMTPTSSSDGRAARRPRISLAVSKMAPARAENGSSQR